MALPVHTPGYETKRYSTKQTRCAFNRNHVVCRHFPKPTSRIGTITTWAANASFTRTPKDPSHHPARSNRHHLLQPHKEPTPQPWSCWSICHSTQHSWLCAASACTHSPDPPWKSSSVLSPGGMLCVFASIGWCRTQNNIHPFLIHTGSVHTI